MEADIPARALECVLPMRLLGVPSSMVAAFLEPAWRFEWEWHPQAHVFNSLNHS